MWATRVIRMLLSGEGAMIFKAFQSARETGPGKLSQPSLPFFWDEADYGACAKADTGG